MVLTTFYYCLGAYTSLDTMDIAGSKTDIFSTLLRSNGGWNRYRVEYYLILVLELGNKYLNN